MATIEVQTTEEEQEAILKVINSLAGETVSVSAIANKANMSQHRARYTIVDLIALGKIMRTPTKQFNKHYTRYTYVSLI